MTSSQLLVTASAYLAIGTVGWAGLTHLRKPRLLSDAIRRQGVVPHKAVRLTSATVVTVEIVIATVGVVALFESGKTNDFSMLLKPLLLSLLALYLAYSAYSAVLLLQREDVPCGCASLEYPMNIWVVVRTVTLALITLLALLRTRSILGPTETTSGMALLIGTTIGLLLWNIPGALSANRQVGGWVAADRPGMGAS